MDHQDAEIALGLIGDYWPGRALSDQQTVVWASAITKTGAAFDRTCETIAAYAAESPKPPTLADLCARIRPTNTTNDVVIEERPATTPRGRALAAHVSRIGRTIGRRLDEHNHHNGWQNCPVCSKPARDPICGNPDCFCAVSPVRTTHNP